MKNIIDIEAGFGHHFSAVAQQAKEKATATGSVVRFVFNEVTCLVSATTILSALGQHYDDAHMMKWKEIGPDCPTEYSPETQAAVLTAIAERAARQEAQRKEYEAKDAREREAFELRTGGVEIDLRDADLWASGLAKNQDSYGKCIYDYAEAWAKLMQVEIADGMAVKDVAEKTSHQLGFFGISGFMYGAAVSVLSHTWKHGEELRKWHNKEYGHEGDGVVNPAVLTIGTKS